MQDMQRNSDGDIRIGEDNKFLRWLDNYWYHYKWRTIIVGFFVLVFVFVFVQCQSDPKKDIVVAYCGPAGFLREQTETVRTALQDVMPADFDGNGTKYVEFVRYQHLSPEELEKDKEENNGEGTVNLTYNADQLKQFNSFIQMGVATADCSVLLVSPYVYGEINDMVLVPLTSVWEDVPASAYDTYTVRLGDTAFYQNNAELQKTLPADTLLCLAVVTEKEKDSTQYRHSIEMFRAMAKMP